MSRNFTTLLLGDVYGDPGCRVLFVKLGSLIKKYHADFVVINCENACKGFGVLPSQADMLFNAGANVLTSGNHIWQQEEILDYLDSKDCLLRPANYGNSVQGHGYVVTGGVCVINLQGRMNMVPIEDPFKASLDILKKLDPKVKTIFVDFHAESSDEKEALGFFLDGKVTAVVGTHIHVPTMDEKILPKGTAYVTDLGMCGPKDSIIGCDPDLAVRRQLTQMPLKAQVYDGDGIIHGVCVVSDSDTGKAISIERITE